MPPPAVRGISAMFSIRALHGPKAGPTSSRPLCGMTRFGVTTAVQVALMFIASISEIEFRRETDQVIGAKPQSEPCCGSSTKEATRPGTFDILFLRFGRHSRIYETTDSDRKSTRLNSSHVAIS